LMNHDPVLSLSACALGVRFAGKKSNLTWQ
jgi:hypothetical protein